MVCITHLENSGTGKGEWTVALQVFEYEFHVDNPKAMLAEKGHYGVVGSGDLEIIFERKNIDGVVKAKVNTPASDFRHVWEKILKSFVEETGIGNVAIEINDDNATPIVISLRLRQAFAEVNYLEEK